VEVGRLELWPASRRVACSQATSVVDLRFLRTDSDRWCPQLSLGADRACTQRVPMGVRPE
jgi:hypothetical protein